MWRLKVDACFATRDRAFQLRAAPAALHGQESSKKEGVSWKSGTNERGKNGTGTGQDIYGEPALATGTDETEARIRYSWHAGICHERDGFAAGDFLDQRRRAGGFIVLMQAEHRLLDVMVEQEHGRMTRILGRDEIGFAQSLKRSQRDILQIPNRCWDNGEQDVLPALGNRCRQFDGRVLRSHGNRLALDSLKIAAAEKRRLAADSPSLKNAARHAIGNLVTDIEA
jgi:hypothetical protein